MRLTLLLLALTLTLFSQPLPSGVRQVTSVEGVTEYLYPNGLRVLLYPDSSKPTFTVCITYLAGSRHEGYGEAGMAHLLEHVLFLRTNGGRDIRRELAGRGADSNGTTNHDFTNYFETIPASDGNLRWALALEAGRMLNARLDEQTLGTERTVVRNEFEAGENDPMPVLTKRVLETAYRFHNYGRAPIGIRPDIERVPIARLAAFYRQYYQPDNAVLAITGKFDPSKALAFVAETLGKVPRPQRSLDRPYTAEPTQDGERSVTLRRAGDAPIVMAVYRVPAAAHPDTAAVSVLANLLGATDGRIAGAFEGTSIAWGHCALHDPGYLLLAAMRRREHSLPESLTLLVKTIEGLADNPPTGEEVERARMRLLKEIELPLTDSGRLAIALGEWAAYGDWRLYFYVRDQIRKVAAQDVLRVAKAYLKPSNRTVGTFIPTSTPDRAEIAEAPPTDVLLKDYRGGPAMAKGEDFVATPANIEARAIRKRLPAGLDLVMLPKATRGGSVVAQLNIRFGSAETLAGKAAIAGFTGSALMAGTKHKHPKQVQSELDRLKAKVFLDGRGNTASVRIETVETDLDGALRLAAEILKDPSFSDVGFEGAREGNLTSLESRRSEPDALAVPAIMRHLNAFARDDIRNTGTLDEEIAAWKKVKVEEVREFHRQFYGASNGELAVVGQFDPVRVERLAGDLFGEWRSPSRYERLADPYRRPDPMNRTIMTPDKQNAFFIAGLTAKLSDEDPDYPAMVLASYIVGGFDGSRLFRRIRGQEGLTYSVGSIFVVFGTDANAGFGVHAICNPRNVAKVEAGIKDELSRILKDGFTAEEVERARKAWLEERAQRRANDAWLAGTLASRQEWNRTMKWDEALEDNVRALTARQVSDAFRHHIDLSRLSVVKAGDFRKADLR